MKYELIQYALSRMEWQDTEYFIFRNILINGTLGNSTTIDKLNRLKLRHKTKGLINHDRVLHYRKEI